MGLEDDYPFNLMKKNNKICFVSVDVESDLNDEASFSNINSIEHLLGVFRQNSVPATLFVSGLVLEKFPELVKKWSVEFEIGSHNYTHDSLTNLSAEEKTLQINNFQNLYRRNLGKTCVGFRAPRHLIDNEEIKFLQDGDFEYDSSVIPDYVSFKRYGGFKGKAPLMPYRVSEKDYLKKGESRFIELPLTPVLGGFPLAGTWIRYFGPSFFRTLLFFRKPNFLSLMMHSWDAIEFNGPNSRNSGEKYLHQLEIILKHLKKISYEFKSGEKIANELK
ncbi:MAG: hypothetical protein COU81_02165 [Candidatus Portnoybacteria bacterium CG10_big_fil_rev_8_21_14_0_10_36_7]|uniref:NodB homology domain-containing protein n=1 Tax=Candidatus Portnoybacteria bacterium CG10_big_fil_rev_8_21_14_0_10_36_7 TaxID=1974812 RepID=A0A2M8KE46_9BACT|nr:MAG: hypothetical protein COU81_02165 [Candidatus Portnoybacteria bacterium CG10_big_fil_rev_8_21_14_0_10_36_7]